MTKKSELHAEIARLQRQCEVYRKALKFVSTLNHIPLQVAIFSARDALEEADEKETA